MSKEFIKDIVKYLPSQIAPGIVGIVSIPIFTRIFLPKDYGYYSLVMATVMVLSNMLGWLPISIIRFHPIYEKDKKLSIFYGNIILLEIFSLSALVLVSYFVLSIIRNHITLKLYSLLIIGIGVVVVNSLYELLQYFLRSKRQVSLFSTFSVLKYIGSLGGALSLIFIFKRDIQYLLWGSIFTSVIIFPALLRAALKGVSNIKLKIVVPMTEEIAKYGLPLMVGNIAAWILGLSDRYLLEAFRGSREVGIYSASYNISEKSMLLITTLFTLASGPLGISIWEKEGKEKSSIFINKVTRYYLLICIPMVTGLALLSKPLIRIMAGEQYFEGYKIISFVTIGVLFLGLQQRFQSGLIYHNKTKIVATAIIVSGLLNIFINVLFIPKYGYMAAAISTVVSYSFLLILMIVLSRRYFRWKFPFISVLRIFLASGIMGLIVYYGNENINSSDIVKLLINISVGILSYLIILFFLGELKQEKAKITDYLKMKIKERN